MDPYRHGIVALVVVAVVSASISLAAAEQVRVTTTDGKQHEGELVAKTDDAVTLKLKGVTTVIDRQSIRRIERVLSVAEEYRKRRAKLKDDDLAGRLELAKWLLYAKNNYALAEKELADLAKRNPDRMDVKDMLQMSRKRLKLLGKNDQEPAAKDAPDKNADPDGKKDDKKKKKDKRLTKEQINIIRVYEVDLDATRPPRVIVPRDVEKEFLAEYADQDERLRGAKNLKAFSRSQGHEKLRVMFDLKARKFYPKVKIARDPAVMATFKKSVHRTYVLNYCGTSRCHGGKDAKGLKLFADRPHEEATAYTNFLLLHRYEKGDGYMIDREKPEESYLLQYGLPRVDALTPHPDVKGWQPKFRKKQDRTYRRLLAWIDDLNDDPIPEYPVKYPPGASDRRKKDDHDEDSDWDDDDDDSDWDDDDG